MPHARLLIVGQRHSQKAEAVEYEQQLRRFADENFEPDQIQWLGRSTEVPRLMQQAKLLIHCAKQEPLGRVLLEAAAAGLPMVTTKVGGTPEILQGLEELMFAHEKIDKGGLPMALRLLQDPEFHEDVSRRLRSVAEAKFSAARAGGKLLDCYIDVVGT